MRILVVEDDEGQRSALVTALEASGHALSWAATGEGALELLRTEVFDVVLLDLDLGPGIDGWEVARRKLRSPAAAVPVIVITGEPAESVFGHQHDNPLAGAVLLLSKPTDLDRLERTLALLEKSQAPN